MDPVMSIIMGTIKMAITKVALSFLIFAFSKDCTTNLV